MKTVGILLAGGQSRRYGSPKAFAKYNDHFFYEWAYKALETVCNEVIIIAREELINLFPKCLHVTIDSEQFSGKGPLAGIYSGMEKISADQYIVLPCDMPYLTDDILKALKSYPTSSDILAVKQDEVLHPLISVWKGNMKEQLYTELSNDKLSVIQFLAKMNTEWIQAENLTSNSPILFQNINKPT